MRFLVDENLPRAVADALTRAGHDALAFAESKHRGETDEFVWSLAIYEQRIIVRRDVDLPLALDLWRAPGLVLVRDHGLATDKLIKLCTDALAATDALFLRNAITVVEPGSVRTRRDSRPPTIPPPALE